MIPMIPFSYTFCIISFRTERKLDHEQDSMEESDENETTDTSLEAASIMLINLKISKDE